MYWVGLPLQPLVQVAAVVQPLHFAQFLLGMRVEIHALAAHGVRQQHFGGQPRHGDGGIFQQFACPGAAPSARS